MEVEHLEYRREVQVDFRRYLAEERREEAAEHHLVAAEAPGQRVAAPCNPKTIIRGKIATSNYHITNLIVAGVNVCHLRLMQLHLLLL